MSVRGCACGLVAIVALAWSAPATADSALWDEVARPHRRQCAQLLDEAAKLLSETARLRDAADTQRALVSLRRAVELCGGDREVEQRAGELFLGAREFVEGRRHLESARRLADAAPLSPERDIALAFYLGFAREVTGDLDGAIEEHRRLESMGGMPAPNQYLVHYNLGDELMAVGRLSEAIDEYRRAVSLKSDKPVVRLALAVALDRDGQLEKSRAELTIVLSQDPQLKRLATEEYVFVPATDAHYYRALALLERGWSAEARLELRTFVGSVPGGPYSPQARIRLADAEKRVDARELEASSLAVDKPLLARALIPAVLALEDCLPGGRVSRVRLLIGSGMVRTEPEHPAADCLDRALSRVDRARLRPLVSGTVTIPLAGRRGAASLP